MPLQCIVCYRNRHQTKEICQIRFEIRCASCLDQERQDNFCSLAESACFFPDRIGKRTNQFTLPATFPSLIGYWINIHTICRFLMNIFLIVVLMKGRLEEDKNKFGHVVGRHALYLINCFMLFSHSNV